MDFVASEKKVVEYLRKHSPVNTFRLSRHLEIDRNELIGIIEDLRKKRLINFKHGSVSIIEKPEEINADINESVIKKLEQKVILRPKKPKRKKLTKKVRVKKKYRKIKIRRKKLSAEKQEELEWIKQRKLDLEKLKIDIRLLSLSNNPEGIEKLRASIAELRDMINQKIRKSNETEN